MIHLKYHYAPLELKNFGTFKEKLDVLTSYLEIGTVFCRLPEDQLSNLSNDGKYNVIEVLVPGGQTSYIKSYLQESLQLLKKCLEEYLNCEDDDHYSINKTLEEVKDLCINLNKKNDVNRSLLYNENEMKFLTIDNNGNWFRLYIGQTILENSVQEELLDHFYLRKEFYEELTEIIYKKILTHADFPSFPKKPYMWNSEDAHLEIAELLHALIQTRVQIKQEEKGSISKLVKEFYNLFGLDDAQYHQKLQSVRKRIQKTSWLQELPDYINSVQKKFQLPKNNS